jgi:hypothetical protein
MKKNYMARDKFFYVSPVLFSDRKWPFKTRYAIGVRLADFRARNEKLFRFIIKNNMYEIPREDAFRYGLRYILPHGALPNLIPLDAFRKIALETPSSTEPTVPPKATEKPETGGQQFQFSFTL